MITMRITRDPLNQQALTLTDAEGLIRLAVKDAMLKGQTRMELDRKVMSIIHSALDTIKIPTLKRAAYTSLITFYNTQRRTAEQLKLGGRLLLFLALSRLWESKYSPNIEKDAHKRFNSVREAKRTIRNSPYIPDGDKPEILNYGNALNKYHERYFKDYVKPAIDRMAKEEALDPDSQNYLNVRSSLRNRAEREVRYQNHIDEINKFREQGVKLVICSSHANCSERCRPWQGRVYSLDGTSGTTPDGRKYVPLEEATDILTPNGKWYNGLLGFNCRHYLVPYKDGYKFPKVSEKTEEREYKIDQKQRYMERKVREWRTKAEMYHGISPKDYRDAKNKADTWYRSYVEFSRKNNRAFYRSRITIL